MLLWKKTTRQSRYSEIATRIQFENIGSPFFPKYGVKPGKNTYREMSGITIYEWFIDFSGYSNETLQYDAHKSAQRNYAHSTELLRTCVMVLENMFSNPSFFALFCKKLMYYLHSSLLHQFKLTVYNQQSTMSSTPVSSPIKVSTPSAPVKATKATGEKKEKVVKEKVVKEKVVKKKVKAVEVVAEVNAAEVNAVTDKKARAASLPAKYGKFIQYSYYLIRAINNAALEQNGAVLIDEDQFITAAHVFDNIANQQAFVASFLENKNIAKEMRTHLADKKKAEVVAAKAAAKAEKEVEKNAAKAAAKAEKDAAKAEATPTKEPKQTKPKSKNVKATVEPDLVTSLVALANTSVAPTVAIADNEEELDVRVITINAKEYLIDDNNNLYDSNSHEVIGIWNKETNSIIHA